MTKPAGYYVKDPCERCGKWRQLVQRNDDYADEHHVSELICKSCYRGIDKQGTR